MSLLNGDLGRIATQANSGSIKKTDANPLQGVRALIADRSIPTQKHIKDELSSLGASAIEIVNSVGDLFNALRDAKYNMIFVDYSLEEERPGSVLFEELATRISLPKQCAFFGLTDDTMGSSIVSMCEAGPDDILIKPFSAETIGRQTQRVYRRKKALRLANKAYDEKDIKALEMSVQDIALEAPKWKREATKVLVAGHMKFGRSDRAAVLIKELLKEGADVNLELYMGQIMISQKKMEEAEKWLKRCAEKYPDHVKTIDLYAERLWANGKREEALSMLEQLGVAAHGNSQRLRMMADLAQEVGDEFKYKTYLSKVIERTRGSNLASEDDYYRMADLFLENRKFEEAMSLEAIIRKIGNKSYERDFPSLILQTKSLVASENMEKAQETLDLIVSRNDFSLTDLSPGTLLSIAELCFVCGLKSVAMSYAKTLMKKDITRGMKERLKRHISAIDVEEMT